MLSVLLKLLPTVVSVVTPLIKGKVKTAVVEKETGTVAVVGKPWWMSKTMLGVAVMAGAGVLRYFGYDLGAEGVDEIVQLVGGILIVWGRAKAVS